MSLSGEQTGQQVPGQLACRPGELPASGAHGEVVTPAPAPASASADDEDDDAAADEALLLSPQQQQQPYVDPTPATPRASRPPSCDPPAEEKPRASDGDDNDDDVDDDDDDDDDREAAEGSSPSEIHHIMEQFSEPGGGPDADEVMSPRLEMASPLLGGPALHHHNHNHNHHHPPRKSSLEPLAPSVPGQIQHLNALHITTAAAAAAPSDDRGPPVPPKDGAPSAPRPGRARAPSAVASPTSPQLSMHRMPPPEPEPEPALPFDFHRFLEQLRNKKADPVARYLKSFLTEFGKRQWMVHEQVKIIGDFLAFIANKMVLCEVWRDVSDAEFDNAREGMEKLVMNRLYAQTFSPAIPAPRPIPGAKPRRKGADPPMGPGRRGQHQEDVERDDIVAQKIAIYGWVREEHLDIAPLGDSGRRFLKLAQQELLKIQSYRAPRDKIICVLNCCKVIFGLLKHNKADSSADSFMPLLIYVVLHSAPAHLVSNVQYILRFRNQDKLGGEAGYYLSSLMGAVHFIESLDRTSLTVSDAAFERFVEAAVSAIAEKHQAAAAAAAVAAAALPEPCSPTSEDDDSGQPIGGVLLRTIQNPLSTIGRIFSDDTAAGASASASTTTQRSIHAADEAAARQATAEAAQAQRVRRSEHANVVETLAGMFPDLDKDVISDVVYQKEGRVGLAVDACLALST